MVTQPSAAERYMAILAVHVEPMDLPTEKNGEYQVSELVCKGHHPANVLTYAWNDETHEERDKTDGKVLMQPYPSDADCFQAPCPDEHPNGNQEQNNPHEASEDIPSLFHEILERHSLFHTVTKIPNPLESVKNLFTFD